MTMKAPLRQSPLHNVSRNLGATIAAFQGWQVPTTFSNAQAELDALKSGVGLADISWLGKLELKGPEEELQALNVPEGEVWHLARGHLLITCDPGQEDAISEAIAHHIAQIEASNAGQTLWIPTTNRLATIQTFALSLPKGRPFTVRQAHRERTHQRPPTIRRLRRVCHACT